MFIITTIIFILGIIMLLYSTIKSDGNDDNWLPGFLLAIVGLIGSWTC